VLVAAVVDAIAGADDGSAVKRGGRPGQPEPRAKVAIVRAIVGRTARAKSTTALYVYNRGAVPDFMHDRIEFVAQAQVQRQVRRHLEFILEVTLIKGAAVSYYAFAFEQSGRVSLVVDEVVGRRKTDRRGGDCVAGVIELNAPDVNAGLQGMAAPKH